MIRKTGPALTILYLMETAGRGGAESVVLTLAKQRGDRAHVASLRSGWLTEQICEAGVECSVLPYPMRSDLLLVFGIARLIDKVKPDLVHCHCFTMNTLGAVAAAIAGVPSIGTVHGAIYDLDTRARRLAYRVAGRLHHRIVTVSHYLRDELHNRTGVPTGKIEAIYNGVAATDAARDDTAFVRCETGVADSEVLVGSVGMLRPEKGHLDLIEALAIARKAVPGMKLLLVGDGKCKEELMRRAEECRLNGAVKFASSGSNVMSMMGAMDIFALPSHTEGLSIATIEAMSCGRPVVVTDCGGPTEIVSHGVTGLVVPPCDPPSMAEALVRLARDSALRTCLAANGRARARDAFSVGRMLERYEQVYEEAAR